MTSSRLVKHLQLLLLLLHRHVDVVHLILQQLGVDNPRRTVFLDHQWASDCPLAPHDLQKHVHIVLGFPNIRELLRQVAPQCLGNLHSASVRHDQGRFRAQGNLLQVFARLLKVFPQNHLAQVPHHQPYQPHVLHKVLSGTLSPAPPTSLNP